jgi:group I intron endonuclease
MTIGIYCIQNTADGKMYFGQSISAEKRMIQHRGSLRSNHHYNRILQRAWNKHGEDSFLFYLVVVCEKSELDKMEIEYIREYKTFNQKLGYNMELGGVGEERIFSDETKKKIAKALMGNKNGKGNPFGTKLSEDTKKKMSLAKIGKKKSDETKKRMSEATKRRWANFSEEVRERIKEKLRHPVITDETRRKMSESAKIRRAREKALSEK